MYQNAPPPHYNQGYGAPSPQSNQYGGGGYYDGGGMPPQQQGYNNPGYGAPSPVSAAYQRANAAMARGPSPSNSGMNGVGAGGAGASGGGSASGLIRLTLRKPMGIVFEPMTDPHNPSQQRGVRICDLPRTGAAAMSQKLEVGDELLSINDKTMSRLTFDEIMDFIIAADKERVDLLFRRPGRNKEKNNAQGGASGVQGGPPLSPMGLGGVGSNSNSVKWIDEKSDVGGGKVAEDVREPDRDSGRGSRGERGGRGGKVRDDPSVDDTYNDGYTVESQSQYTMETYEDDRGRGSGGNSGRGGRGSRFEDDGSRSKEDRRNKRSGRNDRDRHRSDHHSSSKRKSSSGNDPVESSGFLDLLIDTLCTSVMGRDARDMCGDRSTGDKQKADQAKSKYDDDDEFTVDDGTYATYDENEQNQGRRMEEDESLATEDEQTFVTNEDDGTQTLESKDAVGKKQSKEDKKGSKSKSRSKDQLDDVPEETPSGGQVTHTHDIEIDHMEQFNSKDPPHGVQSFQQMSSALPDPPTKTGSQIQPSATAPATYKQQHLNQHNELPINVDHQMNEQESAIASGIALPLKELEYDDRVDYAADVSVMESLGGPSLLVERARHESAIQSGADRASFENLDRRDPELAELVARHGNGFVPDPGMTREETAFRDPYKFYEFAVCALLRENEPEKVRLLSKLMAKYRGRERHLINKLSARYDKDGNNDDNEGGGNAASGDQAAPEVVKAKSGASQDNNANVAKSAMSGMERIREGEDGEEETAGSSSVLNDPSRANMAAIETAKKKMEGSNNSGDEVKAAQSKDPSVSNKKSGGDDGWPPAMSDPWGANSDPATSGGAAPVANEDDHAPSPIHDDEGSYSDGSSYTDEDGSEVDGTSPAIIAQVSELLNYVYGKTSVAGQIDRVSTIMRAYEGREAVLLELLETKALIKANADSNKDGAGAELPASLRNSPGLNNNNNGGKAAGEGNSGANGNESAESSKKLTPQTPVSVLTAPTMAGTGPASPATLASPKSDTLSPSAGTLNTVNTTASKKKKKGIFGGFFGGKKKDKKGNFPSDGSAAVSKSSPGKNRKGKAGKKGQMLGSEDDRSI